MKKLLTLCTLLVLNAGLLMSQSDRPSTSPDANQANPQVTRVDTPRHENNWGWMGLLGLIGLAGLRRKPSVSRNYETKDVRRAA